MNIRTLVRRLIVCGIMACAGGVWPASARAADVPYFFLVKNGFKNLYAGQAIRLDQGLFSWYGFGTLHAIVNGQQGGVLGTAFVQAYSRSIPEPGFAPIQPLGALINLQFNTFNAHFTLFETPAGPRTTIAVLNEFGAVDTSVSGVWVLGDAATVAGGTPDDMVIAALVHFSSPHALHTVSVVVPPYFPQTSFENDATFTRVSGASIAGLARCLGSGYGRAQGPLRVYTRCDDHGLGLEYSGSLLVMHTGGDNYAVQACSRLGSSTSGWALLDPGAMRCSVSGSGSILSRMAGSLSGMTIGLAQERTMIWPLFFSP